LGHLLVNPGLLYTVQRFGRSDALDRGDGTRHVTDCGDTGAGCNTFDKHCACAAGGDAATELCAGKPGNVPQRPQKRHLRVIAHVNHRSVHLQLHLQLRYCVAAKHIPTHDQYWHTLVRTWVQVPALARPSTSYFKTLSEIADSFTMPANRQLTHDCQNTGGFSDRKFRLGQFYNAR
jgi:hypothetical protein